MSYSRSSFRSTSSSYKYTEGLSDDSYNRTSLTSSSRSSRLHDDSLTSRTSRFSSSITGTGDDDITSIRRTSAARSSRFDDDDSGLYSSYRRTSRTSSRGDEDDLGLTSYRRRTSGLSDDDDSYSFRRTKISSTYEIDDGTKTLKNRQTTVSTDSSSADSAFSSYLKYGAKAMKQESVSEEEAAKPGDIYVTVLDYEPPKSDVEGIPLKEGQEIECLETSNLRRWKVKTITTSSTEEVLEGWVPSCYLEKKVCAAPTTPTIDPKMQEAKAKREILVKELVETEEDFARDLLFVVNNYIKEMEGTNMPKELRDQKDVVFSNFKAISDVHNNVLVKGVQYYAAEPAKLGKTFLRLERDFDQHVNYCRDEPLAQKALSSGPLKEYFDEFSKKIGDEKTLSDHLKLPIQRINDYQLLLKEILKCTARLMEETDDLERALELMQAIPQRIADQKYINSLHGYKGNINKLGRILKREWLDVTDENNVTKERQVFLFKRHMLVVDERRISEDKSVYIVKNIIKLQEADIQESVEEGDSKKIVVKSKKSDTLLTFKAKSTEQKEQWVNEIHKTSVSYVAEDLGDDELVLVQEEAVPEPEQKKPKLTKEGTETKSLDVEEKVVSETDAKVEILEDFEAYEEMNTAITESLRSGSLTSLEDFQSALEDEPSCVTASEMEGAPGKPLFPKPLHGLVCSLGESPTFECEVATTTPTSVMWLKDNMPITSSDRHIISSEDIKHCLTIKNVVSEDAGLYTVVVTNSQGTNSCSATLCTQSGLETERPTSPGGSKLPYAPVFKEKLMNSQLIEGTNARFTVTVNGVPEPTVTFYKDENELKLDKRVRIISTISGVYELAIDNVTSADAGKYSCIAVNSEGRDVTAGNITITKEKVVLQVTQESEAVSISTGRDSKEPQHTWFKDGSEIEASERFKVAYSDEEDTLALVFQKVTPEDAGLYTCIACTSSGKISCSAELTVQGAELPRDHEAPVLTASLKDVEVSEGSSALLELKSSGYPKPKITWFKDGEEVKASERIKFLFEDSDSYTLVIKKVQKSDSGEYSAILKNDMGEVKCSCQLLVKSAPVFKKQMKDMAVMTDEPVKFEVEVEGAPTPEIKWMKDGQQLLKSDRIKLLHEAKLHTLLIEKAKCEDSGNYSCVASNTSGVQSGFAALSVNAPASFVQKMKNTETMEEEMITFSVKVAGNPKPKVKWMKNGSELKQDKRIKIEEDENIYMLIIEKVKSEDAGTYSCETKNDYGSDTTTGDLTVSGKPSFTQKLSNVEVSEGEDADFTVKVSGKPEPKIKWYIGSMEITESQNYKFIDDKDSGKYTLQVKSVDSKLTGEYKCEASNSVGTESTSGKLSVKETWEEPKFVQVLKDTTVKKGEDAQFTVKIKGHPKPTVKWTKDGADLTIDNKHIKVVEEASDSLTLVLKNVDNKDVGSYSCEIKNEQGSDTSSGKLTVQSPAAFLKGLKDTEVEENMDVSFNVKIAGDPRPKVKWTKDGAELTIDGEHIKSLEEESAEYTLIIQQVTKDDIGIYSCEISNEYSKDVSSCKLGVAGKPTFKKKLVDKQSVEGEENVEFVVEVDGSPAPDVKWYKDNSEISSGEKYKIVKDKSTHKIVIKKVTSDMEGNFTCKAKNPHGSADTSAAFTVQLKPKIIEGLKDIEVEEGKPISLTVNVAALASSDVKWKKNGEEVFEEATIKLKKELPNTVLLIIEKTTITMSGKYECIVSNKLGEASTSGKLTVKSKPRFEKGLKDMEVWTSEESVFEVIVKGSPAPSVTWSKDDKTVTKSEYIKITEEEDTYRLVIKSTKMEDCGIYKCIAKNDTGEASESASLSVKNADDSQLPTFIKGLNDQEILVGDAVRMEVKVVGKPKPSIIWLKNGEELSANNRIKISSVEEDNYYSITIKDITLEDEGEYVCKATNAKGESSSSSKLLVEEPTEPEIKGMKNVEAALAGAAKFEAEVTGVPAPDVQWLKNGKPLRTSKDVVTSEDDTTHHFTVVIRNVKEEHVGSYTCIAKNSAGEASSEGKLTIKNETPAFLKEIGDQETKKGSTVIFEVRVSGYPLPEISWLKSNNVIIAGDHCKISSKDDVFKLEITNASVDDIGTYICKAKNSTGEVQCKGALHLVEVTPTIQKGLHSIVTAKEGESLKLEAKFDGEPKPDITWTKDNSEIKPSDHVKIETQPDGSTKLTIDNLKPEDAGAYAVVARNSKGQTDSQSKVAVEPKTKKAKPNFIKQLEAKECIQGEKVELTAKVSGEPMPVVTWFKDGIKVESSDRIITKMEADGKIQLVIDATTSEDSGEYKAVATNDAGESSSSAKITVNVPAPSVKEIPTVTPKEEEKEKAPDEIAKTVAPSAEAASPASPVEVPPVAQEVVPPPTEKALPPGKVPEFLTKLKPVQFTEGEPGVLTAKITGEPLPQIKWLKNGKPILPSDHYAFSENPDGTVSLKIDKVRPEDAGKYAIVISNDRGEEKSEAPVATIPVVKGKARPKFRIVDGLQPVMLTEGKDGRLQAKVTGEVKPTATWKLNGKLILSDDHVKAVVEDNGTYALIINNATSADAGKYTVVFTDASGEEESEALVTVVPALAVPPLGKKPEFTQDLQPKQISAGQPLTLTAKVAGEPKASIKWLKDGDEIKAGPGIVIKEEPDGTNILTIENATLADAGKFVIVATNDEGKTRSAAVIDVKGPPKKKPEFLEDLQPVACNDGEPVTMKAKISGEPKPQVKWIKDGEEIKPSNHIQQKEEPSGGVVLHIPEATPKDSGKYSVAIANEEGETRCSAPLTVNQPPVFVKPLMPVTVINGFPAKLETKVTGVPKPDVQWLKNGEPFVADGEHVKLYSPDGTVSLVFEKTKLEHSAKYTCNAKNNFGESHVAGDLKVIEKEVVNEPETAPTFLTPLSDVSVLEEETIKFEASISGNPMPDIHWFLDEQPILPSNNVHPTFDGKKVSLEIKHCNPQHAGNYECHLVNRAGNAVSEAKAKVKGFSAPEFIQKLVDIESPTKDPVKLVCRVKGVPEPTVEWYRNGDLLYPGIKYSMLKQGDQCHLNIPYPRARDSGKYECLAKNVMGEDKCSAKIEISDVAERGEQPIFLKKLINVDALEGRGAKFTACVTGIPKPLVKWFKDGEQLEPSDHYRMEHEPNGILRLMIYQTKPTDIGEYRVSVSNKYGSDTCTARLHLEGVDEYVPTCTGDVEAERQRKTAPPGPLPDPPFFIRMTDTYLTLGWRPSIPSSPRVPVAYEVEMCPHPDGAWTSYKSGLKDSICDVHGLIPGKDYRFRIRVENKHGISDPSPYTTAHRSKIHPPLPGDYKPKDYELEHPPLEKQLSAPRFLRQEEETTYGVRGQPVRIEFWVYGNPQPEVSWHFNGLPVESGKYDYLQDRNGQVILFITRMTENDIGTYVCHAVNELGEARQKVKLMIAEVPIFTRKLEETSIMIRGKGKLECCVTGVPFPKIKWFKDWHPLYESSRVKITQTEPDKCSLSLSDVILKDGGLYTCSASNVAGSTSTSGMLSITEAETDFNLDRDAGIGVKPRNKLFEDIYDIGDELGRGTQGIIHHAVERSTGRSLSAKMMHGTEKMRDFMEAEMDIMNQLCHPRLVRLWDAFDTRTSLTLVTDLCGGGELLNNLLHRSSITESNVAHYIKQLLEGLEHMHNKQIGHLGLNIGDLLITRVNSDNLKICDFGLATRLHPGREFIQEYGHPEFISPEIANKQPVTLAADIWSVGIITYLLLTGISPFLGENDRETLKKAQNGKVDFYHDNFAVLSDEAKDFVRKLLVIDPSGRLDVKTALKHPWLRYADVPDMCDELGNMSQLQEYSKKWRIWYGNASCKRFYRRRPLDSCLTHPSHMIYPTEVEYTPPVTPDRHLGHSHVKPAAFDDVTFQQKIVREPIDFRSESQYQSGPDTFLLPLRDKDFPVRVRQYLRLGAKRSPRLADHLKEKHWADCDVVVKERRRFVDVMDEEIYDEKRGLVHSMPLRLQKEVGCLGMDIGRKKSIQYAEASPPFFREKIRDVVIRENEDAVFKCFAVSKPPPLYSWFRNDGILIESSRIAIKQQKDGHCELRLKPGKAYDVGVFKCVARNTHGIAVCRARLKIGDVPGHPEPPIVQQCSDTELYVAWNPPKNDGNSPILCYSLEYKKSDEEKWTKVAKNISHEFFVIKDLTPSSTYHLRLAAKNRFGWGDASPPSEPCNTIAAGSPKVKISKARKYQQEMTERGQELFLDDLESANIEYELEDNPVEMVEGDPLELYNFVSEVARGRFSVIVKVWVKAKNTTLMAKVMLKTPKTESSVWREYDILRSLRHERIVTMEMASTNPTSTILIMEKLSGMDILTYFSCRHQYTEEMVAKVVQQVLDALEYLHFRGICYLELQPDNVVLTDQHHLDVKLIDFGSAQCVPEEGGKIDTLGQLEYMAPETVKETEASSATDIWSVGVLMYILLSGVSPFHGENDAETRSNILYVRYHFDNLYKEVTQEATRFLMQLFKRTPQKRPTVEECFENKWLLPSEFMMKKREHAVFLTHRIHEFSEQFHAQKRLAAPPELLNMFGMSFSRSVSLETDTLEEF